MWNYPPIRKRFYRRPWFMGAALFLLITVGGCGIWAWVQKRAYDERAAGFDYSKLSEMESASVMFDRHGTVLGRLFTQNRDQVALTDLSPALLVAVVAAEDARFYTHHGVDYYGIVRAALKNWQKNRAAQGASTLTQQLARNTFPEQLPPNDKGIERKLLEMSVAQEIERRCGKTQILELYLNRVFFGSGFYGVEAAARGYFGKRAKDLTLSEAATLAGLLKSPSNLSPWRNRQSCIEQRNYVLHRALELNLIDSEQYEKTVMEDLVVKNRKPIHQESYAADLVNQQVERLVGHDSAVSDGYRIYTTIDLDLQKKAEASIREQLASVERHQDYEHPTFAQYEATLKGRVKVDLDPGPIAPPEYVQGAAVVLDNATGAVLALVGGRDFQHSEYNRALAAHVPPGTAFKPFVYAAGFENGLFPGTPLQDAVMDNKQVMIGGTTGILGEWGPEQVGNKYEGTISAREALVKSKNAATVRFGNLAKLERVIALASLAGFESPLRPFPATFLGSSEVTLMEMTLANTIFPNGGWRPSKSFIIERIEDKAGTVIFQAKPSATRVIKPTTAYEVHSCLAEVLERGTADKTFTDLGLKKFDLGGKTGTAYNMTDVWFVGYSSAVTCGVWAGFDKPRTNIYRGAFSNEIALPMWANIMKATFSEYRPKEIAQPAGLSKVEVCSSSGLLATDKCFETAENKETGESVRRRTTYFEWATKDQTPKESCGIHGNPQRSYVKVIPGEEWPRAALAVDIAAHSPVLMKAPTVLGGKDPYNSIQTVSNLVNAQKLMGQVAPVDSSPQVPEPTNKGLDQTEIRRAEPARTVDQITIKESTIKVEPPDPIQF